MCFSHHLQMGFYVSKSISQGTQMTYLQSSNVGHIIGKYKVMFPNDVYWFIPPSTIDIPSGNQTWRAGKSLVR